MDRTAVAKELVGVAKLLTSAGKPTEKDFDKVAKALEEMSKAAYVLVDFYEDFPEETQRAVPLQSRLFPNPEKVAVELHQLAAVWERRKDE